MKTVNVTDITLKVMAQNRGVNLLFREKTALAASAAALGADAVELAPIKNLREDTIIYKTVAQNLSDCTVAIPVGFSLQELGAAWECIKDASHPRLQIEVPVSTVQMEYTYHMKADKMAEKIGELCTEAKKLCTDVEFCALDATRADEDFLAAAVTAAVNGGAGIVTICDTAGIALPSEIEALVKTIGEKVNVPVYVQVSDKLGMAVACAISAISSGAQGVKCAMTGEDALSMGRFSDAVTARGDALGIKTDLINTKIHAGIEDVLAGISREAYETVSVSEKKNILLDADSTIAQVASAAQVLGYDLSDSDCGNVHKAISQVCEKKGSVGAKEFESLIASFAMQTPSTYHLENYTTNCGNLTSAMSQVTLRHDGELLCGVSTGDGPVDSLFRAIEQCIGHHYELDDFQIQAVTEGKEALGSVLVRLRNNGKLYSGNGSSTDIMAASIRAYINALNKIVFEEE